jgi:hypothetical protein
MSFSSRVYGGTVLVMSLALAAGCAMSPKPESAAPGLPGSTVQSAPSPVALDQAEAEPQTLAEAEALLERAKADLDRLALNEPAPPAAGAAAATTPSPAPPARHERADKADDAPAPAAKGQDTCETACRAFSSLTRASDAVCRLDTAGGKRCERARQVREDASQRVASCGCVR